MQRSRNPRNGSAAGERSDERRPSGKRFAPHADHRFSPNQCLFEPSVPHRDGTAFGCLPDSRAHCRPPLTASDGALPSPSAPALSAASAKPSENELGTVTTALFDFFTVSYCMSIVRSFRAASGSP